ncbi:MAG TPA: hypothetical protein VH370_13030 [Humisphaera sp.]|nr:hypothetical protein [Humisphaera sp.]
MANEYSTTWFDLFLGSQDWDQTDKEIGFLRHWLPLERYGDLLDLCCGAGGTPAG